MSRSKKLQKDKQGRFICSHCGNPMESISLTFSEITRWKWNPDKKKYGRLPVDSSNTCTCDHCGKSIGCNFCEELDEEEKCQHQ